MVDSCSRETPRLELVDGIPATRLPAMESFDAAIESVADAIRGALARGHSHLLMNAAGVAFDPPALLDRLRMVRLWAEAADGRLRLALVVRPDFIDPERFGVVAASNFGLVGQVFENETEALAWLRDEQAADQRRLASLPGIESLRCLGPVPGTRR